MSLAPAVFTGAQFHPPEPFATGTSFVLPDVPLLCASFVIYAFVSVAIPDMFAPLLTVNLLLIMTSLPAPGFPNVVIPGRQHYHCVEWMKDRL